MTKYILHGGATRIDNQHNHNFFLEIIKWWSNILIVQFARKKEIWDDILINVTNDLQNLSPDKKLKTALASENTEEFREQIKNADSIYIMWGNTHILQDYLEKIPNVDKLWTNKTIAGSSAGALVLARYYYENDDDTYNKWLDILPYKCFCHYNNDNKKILDKLIKFWDNSEILTLEETKFIIIEKDGKYHR